MSQEAKQQAIRAITGTTGTYEEDWHSFWTMEGVAAGVFEERMLAWINASLGTAYADVNDAMRAYAIAQGAFSWGELGAAVASPAGSGILLESGDDMLTESSRYLILEQA